MNIIKAILSFIISFFIFNNAQVQTVKSFLYKGTIDGETAVTFYMKAAENPHSDSLLYTSMYRLDKSDEWIPLDTTQNKKNKSEFLLVENGFTGVMILNQEQNMLKGLWISPDCKKQLKTELRKVNMSIDEIEFYEDRIDTIQHEKKYC